MKFNKNEIFTLWIKNPPSKIQIHCWNSWISLGYNVRIFHDRDSKDTLMQMPPKMLRNISLIDLKTLPSYFLNIDTENLLQKTDVWRFYFLYNFGGTWLDSDVYLLRRLPDKNIIISSERTYQSGGRKCKDLFRPNIGVLRFPPNNLFVKAVLEKIKPLTKEDLGDSSNSTSKMIKFQKLLKTKKWSEYNNYVMEPDAFCPIAAPHFKEIYTRDATDEIPTKYGLNWDMDISDSYGVHLWANLVRNKRVDLNKIHESSLFSLLIN